jgi:hypothetical protein
MVHIKSVFNPLCKKLSRASNTEPFVVRIVSELSFDVYHTHDLLLSGLLRTVI